LLTSKRPDAILLKLTIGLQIFTFDTMNLVLFLTALFSIYNTNPATLDTQIEPKITVYLFLLEDCKICRDYAPELRALSNEYHSAEIEFIGVFPNFSTKPKDIEKFKVEYDIPFELKTDYFKKLSKKFGAKLLPEVFVYDHKKQEVLYSGRIDDRYVSIGKRRQIIKTFDLKNALDNINAQKDILVKRTEPIGCFINYNDNL